MTPKQKVKCFLAVRNRIAKNPNNKKGICQLIHMYCKNNNIEVDEILVNDFPELRDYAPKSNWHDGYWYPFDTKGNQKRINDLDYFIKINQI